MAIKPFTTNGGAFNIGNLDYTLLEDSSGTFDPPFINGPAGLKYLDPMPYSVWNDQTTGALYENFDVPAMIMLGDIFGALYEPLRLPQLAFLESVFQPQQGTMPGGTKIFYNIVAGEPTVSATFGQPNTYVLGKLAFGYDGGGGNVYFGQWHWLNFDKGVIQSEMPNPIAYAIFPKPGVQMILFYDAGQPLYGAGMQIAGEVNTFSTGNLPALGH